MRRPLVAGNWKMNLSLAQMRALATGIRAGCDAFPNVEIAVCPPAIYLFPIAEALAGSPIRLGAQDLYYERQGAFTGEISAAMIADPVKPRKIIENKQIKIFLCNIVSPSFFK